MSEGALIIGYGNELRGDDGLGPYAAEWLAAGILPPDRRIACRELTPELAVPISAASLVIFVDANSVSGPGEIACAPVAPPPPGGATFSHAFTPALLLALARDLYGASPLAWLLSVGVATLDFTEGLSPAVQAALPALRERLRAIVAATDYAAEELAGA